MTELTAGAGATTLLPGNPESVRDLARRLETLAGGLDDAAVHLAAIQSGTWRGSAGDAFRSVLDEQPATFRRAAASFGQARVACTHYADVLEGAQRTAARAASEFDESQRVTRGWQAQVSAYRSAMHPCLPVGAPAPTPQSLGPQPPAIDPGAGQRLYAESLLEGARAEVRATGGRAAAMIEEAARSAPRRPNLLHQAGHQFTEFGGGLGQAVVGMADFVVTYSPERLALDPDGWADDVELLGHGLKSSARHPDRFAAAVLDLKTWETSPARALGHLAPTVFLAAATAGGSAVATASAEAVTATATGAAVAGGISEVAKGSTIVPALADVGELDRLRHEVSGGSHPAGFTPGDGSAAARATAEHIALGGNVESAWYNTRLRAGDVIATVESGTRDGADNVMAMTVRSAPAMADREQGAPTPGSVSAKLRSITVYRINKDIAVAAAHARQIRPPGFIGTTAANSIRIYIPDLHDLIARGVLTPVQIPVGS